jgi:DnaK suppressor protein
MLPQTISIFSNTFSTYIIFGVLAVLAGLVVYWNEIRRDGFDEEGAFDLIFLCVGVGVLVGWLSSFNMVLVVLAVFACLYLISRYWSWSFYRISDILAISLSVGLFIMFLGSYLLQNTLVYLGISFLYFVGFLTLRKFRLMYKSGLVFTIFLLGHVFVGLNLYLILLTMGLVNLYLREKRNIMNTNLPAGFINNIRNLLKRKEKELNAEQKLLLEEDPYLSHGRTEDNEYLDDVHEDISKIEHDLRLSVTKDLKVRVRKALAMIKIGSYGICEVCKKPISKERLQAYPEATTCVEHSS